MSCRPAASDQYEAARANALARHKSEMLVVGELAVRLYVSFVCFSYHLPDTIFLVLAKDTGPF